MSWRSPKTYFGFLAFLGLLWQMHIPAPEHHSQKSTSYFSNPALAEDEDEGEEYEDDEDDYKETKTSKPKTITKTIDVVKNVVEYKPVTETVIILDEAYQKDTDGDQLVDAIDPDPLLKQSEYFTDIDGDGVPNALDQHHDEDDFAYYDFETDENNNGIIDSYEQ